ncbi:MAG: ATP-dependent 6-phosphofructokinase [Lentisphaeria bacterium]|nr:ATP-dependent 6-phosphofructokinase [Lentisphaeria bacterium]
MPENALDRDMFRVDTIGECKIDSPLKGTKVHFTSDEGMVLVDKHFSELSAHFRKTGKIPVFEEAGPREKIFHDPRWSKAAILTAGGLCPGLNSVIKGLTMTLKQTYGVPLVYGIPYGYAGLNPACGYPPVVLDEAAVDNIHEQGGTILGSSRGAQDTDVMLETLMRLDINMLFCVGGDGTLRSAHELAEAAKRRSLNISIIGIPKTIDNDICFMDRTFGFETAVYATNNVITAAHNEAKGAMNGVGLIHVMGRDSGFIAAYASLANTHINYCLVPEEKFNLREGENALFPALFERLKRRHHAVIIVAEGAGQDLIPGERDLDKSGNVLNKNIGEFLKSEIKKYGRETGTEVNIKYFDPTYMIRGVPANGTDAVFCYLLAQNAVHAAFAGRTNMVIGHWADTFTHVPISMAVRERKKIDPEGTLWRSVKLNTWR